MRLQQAIKAWTNEFLRHGADSNFRWLHFTWSRKVTKGKRRSIRSEIEEEDKQISAEMKPVFKAWEHKIIIQDQVIHLRPPIEEARAY